MNTDIKPIEPIEHMEITEISGLDEESDPDADNVLIISNDGYICNIPKKYTYISDFLKGMYEGDSSAGKLGNEIILGKLNSVTLRLVEEYMKYHKGEDNDIPNMPLEDTSMRTVMRDNWDADFLDRLVPSVPVDNDSDEVIPNLGGLIDLLTVSNYLGMNVLLHKLSAKFASFLRNKGEDEISRFLAIYSNNLNGSNNGN
jgi:hypothetical protein